jgi:autotransporter translocation and assembly factor TamB
MSTPAVSSQSISKRRLRRVTRVAAKVMAAFVTIVVVPLVFGVGFLRTERGHELLRRIVVAQARKTVPGLALGRIEGGLVRDLSLRDVDLRDDRGQPAIHVDRLSVRYRLLALLHHEVAIDDLQIEGVQVRSRPDARGGVNLAHLTTPGPASTAPRPARGGWTFSVAHASLDDFSAELEARDGSTSKLTSFRAEGGARLAGDDVDAWVKGLEVRAEAQDRFLSASIADARVGLGADAVSAEVTALKVGGVLADGRVVSVSVRAHGPRARVVTHVEADADAAGRLTVDGTFGLAKTSHGRSDGTPDGTSDGTSDGAWTLGAYEGALNVFDLDPAAAHEGAPAGRLGFSLNATGEGVPLAPGSRGSAELTVSPSELLGVRLLGGHAGAQLNDDQWEVTRSALRAAGGSLVLSGRGQGRRVLADATLAIDGALVRGHGGRIVRGHGDLSLHAEGILGQALAVRGRAGAEDLRIQSLRLRSLALELTGRVALPASQPPRLSARVAGRLVGLVAGDARVEHATLALDVDGPPDAPTGSVSVIATQVLAARGAPLIDRANLKLSGERGRLLVQASARGPRLRAAVSARGTATAEAGDVTIEQLALDVTMPAYRQQVTLMAPTRVRYETGREVVLERAVIKGAGARFTGQATIEGEYRPNPPGRAPLARVGLQLVGASAGGLPPVNAQLQASVTRTRGNLHLAADMPGAAAQLRLDADVPLELPRRGTPRLATRGPASLRLTTNKVQLQAIPLVQRALAREGITGGTVSLDLSASGDIAHPVAHAAFDLRNVMYRNLAGLGRDSTLKTVPGLGGSLEVNAKDGAISADARLLIRDAGVLETHAVLPIELGKLLAGAKPEEIPLRATVKIPTLRLSSLADFTDGLEGIDGQLHGNIDITGTLKRPSGQADLAIDGARVDKLQFKQVQLHAVARQGAVHGALSVVETTGGRLDGSLALERGRDDRLEATLTGKDLDVSFARLFLTNVREVAGIAQLSATAKGTLAAPRLWATLSLGKGRLGITGQPTFRDVRADVALQPGRLDLHDLEMSSGDGHLQGSGWAKLGGPKGLTPEAAVFKAHAHRFLVAAAGSGGARLDGDLAFDAALRDDVLAGRVSVPDANVWLPKTPSATGGGAKLQKIGPHADVRFIDATAQAAAARDLQKKRQAASAALRVAFQATASPVYVRGKDLDLEVRSNVQIGTVPSGPHRGAVTLGGAIHIPRGRINIQSQRFDFDHGDITFDGSWDVNPALDIKLTRQFPDALVVIELRGTPRKPLLRLSSDPGVYDQAQIVSLILTGQPGGQPSNGKSFDPTSAVATAVLSRLADQVAPELGLDVMRVEKQDVKNEEGQATGDSDTRVEVGKYITERIYLSYAHIFGAPETANQNEAHVEYRMTRRWMLETIFGDAGQGGLDALWTYKF